MSVDLPSARTSHAPLLDAVEETSLAAQVKVRDLRARRRLVESNLRLVSYVARRYGDLGVPFDDLFQEGAIGLVRAVERFDPARGVRFSTFAYWWIRKAVIEALENQRTLVRLPAYVTRSAARASQTREQLRQEGLHEPSLDDVAEELEIDAATLEMLLRSARLTIAELNPETQPEHGQRRHADDPAHEAVAVRLRAEAMDRLLARLASWDRELLELRFGIKGGREHSCAEIARKTGVSRQAVSQRVKSALRRLARVDGVEAIEDE